jgi:hypothetical protein
MQLSAYQPPRAGDTSVCEGLPLWATGVERFVSQFPPSFTPRQHGEGVIDLIQIFVLTSPILHAARIHCRFVGILNHIPQHVFGISKELYIFYSGASDAGHFESPFWININIPPQSRKVKNQKR